MASSKKMTTGRTAKPVHDPALAREYIKTLRNSGAQQAVVKAAQKAAAKDRKAG